MKETAALIIGAVVGVVPALTAAWVWLDPVRRKTSSGSAPFLKVATLEALPLDGLPRRFAVVAEKIDAWTRIAETPVGAVYLRRVADGSATGKITALNVVCPHAGCSVDFQPARPGYFCPCHNSTFATDGSINMPSSPSPRALDSLPVEVRGREIWVRFQNFQTGRHDRVPLA